MNAFSPYRTIVQEHTMKSYHAPRLVAIGSIVERTQGGIPGSADGGEQLVYSVGSVGFNL
jgi:hypothetical protein